MEPEIHFADAGQVVASVGALILRISGSTEIHCEDIDRTLEVVDAVCEAHGRVGLIVVVQHGTATPPLSVVRHTARSFMARRDKDITSVAVMLGLRPMAQAAHGMALRMLTRLGYGSLTIESTMEAAVAQMSRLLPELDEAQVIAFYGEAANKMMIFPTAQRRTWRARRARDSQADRGRR